MSIGPVAGGAARAAGKAAAKAAPAVKRVAKKTVQTLEQQIDELEKRLVVGRQKFKEATDPAARKKIADFGISLKKRLDGLKEIPKSAIFFLAAGSVASLNF